MNKYKLAQIIEDFAPLELQEKWDCSGWIVDSSKVSDVKKAMLALTVTDNVYEQAIAKECDIIIAHHPLFYVPQKYKKVQIYSAHTNMDKTIGGTTDTLVDVLGFNAHPFGDFLRIEDLFEPMRIENLIKKVKRVFPNARIVNNLDKKTVSKIAFCAGSGMDLLDEAMSYKVDCYITGDMKYHNVCETNIVLFDVGHFESEIFILDVFKRLLQEQIEVVIADEKSPFKNI